MDQKQRNLRLKPLGDLNAFFWYQIFTLVSVVKKQKCLARMEASLGLRVGLIPLNIFKPSMDFLLIVPTRCFFCVSFLLFMFHVCLYYTDLSVPCRLVITCWERVDLLEPLREMFSCVLSLSHIWHLGSGVALDCYNS